MSSKKSNVDGAVVRLQKIVGDNAGLRGVVKGEVVDASKSEEVKALFSRVGEIDHLVWTSGAGLRDRIGFKDTDLGKQRGECIHSHYFPPQTGPLHRNIKDLFDLKFWGAATAAQAAKFRGGAAASLTLTTAFRKPSRPRGGHY